jgi:histidinol-phosphate aminotransferase
MDEPYATHRFLQTPPWSSEPSNKLEFDGIDLTQARICLSPEEDVRKAVAKVDPFESWDPEARNLREHLAEAHGLDAQNVIPGRNPADLYRAVCRASLAAEDIVALACPTWSCLTQEVLASGARYVDLGRDQNMALQKSSLERVLEDELPKMVVFSRPAVPAATVDPMRCVQETLVTSCLVVVDETYIDYAQTTSAAGLFQNPEIPTERLVVLRRIPATGHHHVGYALIEPSMAERLWRIRPHCDLSPISEAIALASIRTSEEVRQRITKRCEVRETLRQKLLDMGRFFVPHSKGPCLLVKDAQHSAKELADALAQSGLLVGYSPHPSMHEAISLAIPEADELESTLLAFRGTAL